MDPLFRETNKRTAILLVDRSGSTTQPFEQRTTVFDKMLQVCQSLNHETYRVIFWNSPNTNEGRFIRGVMAIPFVINSPEKLATAFHMASHIGGTAPWIGFEAIPPDWITDDTMVYLITDGQIGTREVSDSQNKENLAREIRKLRCQLSIIAVEPVNRNFNLIEQVNLAAGGDIYKIVQNQQLTNKINKFVSHTPNGSFVQINKNVAPPGHAPYGSKYFSMLRMSEFISAVYDELRENPGETEQLMVAQKLSSTLEVLTRDKPASMASDIIRTFARMFTIDSEMVHYIITSAIDQERGNKAVVFANYRAQLKNLFAQADGLLKQDVSAAIGIRGRVISPLISNRVLTGSYRTCDKTVTINGIEYKRAGYSRNVPIFPLLAKDSKLSHMQDQCLRQWVRAVYAAMYKVHPSADEIIYLVLGTALKVWSSRNTSYDVKIGYSELAKCILRKKRLNSQMTEMDRLLSGEPPIPNSGKYEDFIHYLTVTKEKLDLQGSVLKLWYDMCLVVDPSVATAQKKYCEMSVSDMDHYEVFEDRIPDGVSYDYSCIVTQKDISAVGGYYIKPHNGIAGECSPIYLVSHDGLAQMETMHQLMCPICYKTINRYGFDYIGPKQWFDLPESYNYYANAFAAVQASRAEAPRAEAPRAEAPRAEAVPRVPAAPASFNAQPNYSLRVGITNANGRKGRLVIMKGVVGAGKSTAAAKIRAAVEARNGVCLVEGTDKYTKNGMHIRDACDQVHRNLVSISSIKNDDLVVVIDTCGEQSTPKSMFGVSFVGWTIYTVWPNLDRSNMAGYFAWSLRNVLMRGAPTAESLYSLNPVTASAETCIQVHNKKSICLFGRNTVTNHWSFIDATVDSLSALANEYEKNLKEFVVPV